MGLGYRGYFRRWKIDIRGETISIPGDRGLTRAPTLTATAPDVPTSRFARYVVPRRPNRSCVNAFEMDRYRLYTSRVFSRERTQLRNLLLRGQTMAGRKSARHFERLIISIICIRANFILPSRNFRTCLCRMETSTTLMTDSSRCKAKSMSRGIVSHLSISSIP